MYTAICVFAHLLHNNNNFWSSRVPCLISLCLFFFFFFTGNRIACVSDTPPFCHHTKRNFKPAAFSSFSYKQKCSVWRSSNCRISVTWLAPSARRSPSCGTSVSSAPSIGRPLHLISAVSSPFGWFIYDFFFLSQCFSVLMDLQSHWNDLHM